MGNAIEASSDSEAFAQKLSELPERNFHMSTAAKNKKFFAKAASELKLIQHLKDRLVEIENGLRQKEEEMACLGITKDDILAHFLKSGLIPSVIT